MPYICSGYASGFFSSNALQQKQKGDAALGLRTKRSIPLKRTCDVDASILSARAQTLIHHALFMDPEIDSIMRVQA
jgi:hypothetical protein